MRYHEQFIQGGYGGESGEVGGSHGGRSDQGASKSYEDDKYDQYAGSLYDYIFDQLGGGDEKEYAANGGRSYGSNFEAPSYASVEGALDLTPEESDNAENDKEEGVEQVSSPMLIQDSGGGGTGDPFAENMKTYHEIKILL